MGPTDTSTPGAPLTDPRSFEAAPKGALPRRSELGEPNYYAILDVEPSATRVELREAFLRLKSTFNAGSAALYSLISEDEARAELQKAETAFRILNDDVARRDYDVKMGFQGAEPFGREAGERLMFMREQVLEAKATAAPAQHFAQSADPTVVKTARSSLPIIKLKAQKTTHEAVVGRYNELITTSDAGDGDLYRRLREAADVTEDDMVDRTKISIAYLRAIEANRFERLPQAVYVKGFLRSYFRYLSVPDAERLVVAFSTRLSEWQANKKS